MCLSREKKHRKQFEQKDRKKSNFFDKLIRTKGRQMADKMEVAEGSLSPAVDQPEPEQQQPDHKGSRKKSEKHCRIFLIRTLALSHVTTDLLSSVSSHLEFEIKKLHSNFRFDNFFLSNRLLSRYII